MSDEERVVVGRGQGMSVSKVGLKQRAEGLVEVDVEGGCVGAVVVDDRCERGEDETALVLRLFIVAVMVDLPVGKMEGGVLIVVDGKLSVDVLVVTRTVAPEEMLVTEDEDSGLMTENRPDPSARSVIVMVCVAVVSSALAVDDCHELSECVIGVSVGEYVLVCRDRVEDAKQPSPYGA